MIDVSNHLKQCELYIISCHACDKEMHISQFENHSTDCQYTKIKLSPLVGKSKYGQFGYINKTRNPTKA
jgi:hypothetical protein